MSQLLVENKFNSFCQEFDNKYSSCDLCPKNNKLSKMQDRMYYKQKEKLDQRYFSTFNKTSSKQNLLGGSFKKVLKTCTFEEIKEIIGKEGNHSKIDQKGHSYLYHACSLGDLEIIEYFLGLETNKTINNKQNFESYLKAIKKGNFQAVALFVQKGLSIYQKTGKKSETALHVATLFGNVQVVQELIKYQYPVSSLDAHRNTPLMNACRKGKTGIVELLLSQQEECKVNSFNKHEETALILASKSGHVEIVDLLIKNGASVNLKSKANSNCALYEASKNNQFEVVDKLLQNGAYVDTVVDGWTSLLLASQNGGLELAQRLLQHNANLTYTEPQDGFDAFLLATENGHLEVLEYLLQISKKQNLFETVLNKTSNSQETLLHLASNNGHLEIVKFLINLGSNLDAFDDYELTPLMCAAENDHEEIVLFLLENGAKIIQNESFQLENLANEPIKKLIQNYYQINLDFKQLFKKQQNCDYFITNKYTERIGVHSSFVKSRLGGSLENYLKIFQNYEKKSLVVYFSWLYSAILPSNFDVNDDDDDGDVDLIVEINNKLKINTRKKTGKSSLLSDLKTLLKDNDSKNFKLIVNGNPIHVHKFILIARSNLFSTFFKNYPQELSQLKDQSGISFEAISILLKYFYTDHIDADLNENIYSELANAMEYYQLNQKTLLDYSLDFF